MPNILLKIPKHSFPAAHRNALVQGINEAAAAAEGIPADPRKRALCWVLVEEVEAGDWTCGGLDMTAQLLPCLAIVYVPDGVLDASARTRYAQLMQTAFQKALPPEDRRQLATSTVFNAVADSAWGVNGVVWHLADFAKAASYTHLQPGATAA